MKATFKNFSISERFVGEKSAPWDSSNKNHYKITVKNETNEKKITFDFWCSIAQPFFINKNELINAFSCFVEDASFGLETMKQFFNDIGCDETEENIKTWKACKKSYDKLEKLLDFGEDVYSLLDDLFEYR